MSNTADQHIIPVIILNWNGLEDTIECLDSMFEMEFQDFQIFLLDNGSSQNDVDVLTEKYDFHPKVDLIFSDENLGFTKGCNYVYENFVKVSKLKYDHFALLNNDTAVDTNWLGNLLASAKAHKAGVVSSKMINYFKRDIMDNAGHKMLNTAEIIPIGHAEPIEDYDQFEENFGSCAGATLYSKEMIEKIGFFDLYFSTGYEDAELGARAYVTGFKCIYEPTAIVYHKISQSVNKIFDYDYLLSIQKNIFYSFFKLMPLPVLILSIPSFIFKYISVIIIDILFWRPKYMKILFQTVYELITQELSAIRKSRKLFHKNNKTIGSFSIMKAQEFFLMFDIRRFIKYVVLEEKSEYDKIHR